MPADVDALVALWRANGDPPRPARPRSELIAFAAEVERRFGLELPGDYYDLSEVAESFPSFTGLLERMVR